MDFRFFSCGRNDRFRIERTENAFEDVFQFNNHQFEEAQSKAGYIGREGEWIVDTQCYNIISELIQIYSTTRWRRRARMFAVSKEERERLRAQS
jgi:hypothetical protein